jgi:insulysin
MITAPLIQESALEHEAAIVEDEFKTRISEDTTRIRVLEASIANSDHPYSYFKAGNTETLLKSPLNRGINVTQALLDFHHKYYSANIMTLGVVGKESLEELEKMVKSIFNIVPNRNTTLPVWTQSPYGSKQLGARLDIAPLGNIKGFEMSFPIPYKSVDITVTFIIKKISII